MYKRQVGYREAVMETFPRDRRLSSRLNLLLTHYPGSPVSYTHLSAARPRVQKQFCQSLSKNCSRAVQKRTAPRLSLIHI